jgi:predicted N-acetyltransferase YhbS
VSEPGNQTWQVRHELPEDAAAVDALVAKAFGPGRLAKSAYRLREGIDPDSRLSFVAVESATLRGSVRFWPIFVGDDPVLLLGPLAVQSDQRGRGIGIALMQRGIEAARTTDYACIILVGDEPYYSRVGFTKIAPGKIGFPGPVDRARILGLALKPDALERLSGEVRRARIDHPVCADGAPLAGAV